MSVHPISVRNSRSTATGSAPVVTDASVVSWGNAADADFRTGASHPFNSARRASLGQVTPGKHVCREPFTSSVFFMILGDLKEIPRNCKKISSRAPALRGCGRGYPVD